MKLKTILIFTNPIVWVAGIPAIIGVMIGVACKNLTKNTSKVIKGIIDKVE